MHRHKTAARLFGLLFILSFLSYAIGSGLMVLPSGDDYPAITEMAVLRDRMVTGGLLIAVVHSLCNLGLLVLMFHLLKPYGPGWAYAYLGAGLFSTILLAVGAVWLLIPVIAADTEAVDPVLWQWLPTFCETGNFLAYQFGMAVWGLGGLVLCYLLKRSGAIPGLFPLWGWIGYTIFIAGTITELYRQGYGLALSIPGGLFEIALSIRLIIRGLGQREVKEEGR